VQFYSKLNRKYAGDGYMNNAQQSKRKAERWIALQEKQTYGCWNLRSVFAHTWLH
jgi:hypothetical protein